jgi:hypothetical protein
MNKAVPLSIESPTAASYPAIDKALLSMVRSIGGLVLLVKGSVVSRNKDWRCGWVRKVDRWPLF